MKYSGLKAHKSSRALTTGQVPASPGALRTSLRPCDDPQPPEKLTRSLRHSTLNNSPVEMSRLLDYFYERNCYMCERRTVYPPPPPPPPRPRVRFTEYTKKMIRSASPTYTPRTTTTTRVIRLTSDQEAVLQEQFNRWPRAPHPADLILLAAETGLTEEDVEAWYDIRLAQWRKEQGLGGNLSWH